MDYYSFNIDETECSSYNNNTHLVRQFNFFQFSSSQVLETFRTIFTDSWSIVIQGTTIHLLRQHLNLTEMRMNKPIDSLKQALIDRLLQNGKFDLIFHKAQKHANKFIFHVPKNLRIVDEIQEDVPDDEDDIWKRIEELEQNIIFLRVKNKQIKKKQKNAKFYEEFLSTFD